MYVRLFVCGLIIAKWTNHNGPYSQTWIKQPISFWLITHGKWEERGKGWHGRGGEDRGGRGDGQRKGEENLAFCSWGPGCRAVPMLSFQTKKKAMPLGMLLLSLLLLLLLLVMLLFATKRKKKFRKTILDSNKMNSYKT